MIGLSEGNGHPFSYSAIINGYSDAALAASGWQVIYDYVTLRDDSEFGIEGLQVTHAWTQDPGLTDKLCKACLIPNAVSKKEELIGKVDAVIIARDDYERHFETAMPFLDAGLHVFVDKPLSLDPRELKELRPFLQNGRLMSCSAMRYARELDEPRGRMAGYGTVKLIRGTILNSWEKYGVHLLEAILALRKSRPLFVTASDASHTSIAVHMEDGSLIQIDSLGESPKTFRVDIWGTKAVSSHEITDNFTMFRRMLWHFSRSLQTGKTSIDPQETIDIMRLLIAGNIAHSEKRRVNLDEIRI
jgi:predicted dehydrogenase